MTYDEFVDKLEGVEEHGSYVMALCPGHEESKPSLSVSEGDGGKIIVKCHAGCTAAQIVKGMELALRDLFPGNAAPLGEPEAVYQYHDEAGNVLFESLRFPGKKFRYRHHDPEHPDAKEDGFVYNMDDVRRVIYNLPAVRQAVAEGRGVYVVEGEKDADSLIAQDIVATCNPMGAGKWRDEYTDTFTGAVVTIVSDRDEAGRKHAQRVLDALRPVTQRIRVVQAKTGKDSTDHLAAGHEVNEMVPVRQGPRRGIVTAQQMSEAGREHLLRTELDIPGYTFIQDLPIVARQGRMYALGAYTSDGKSTFALQATRMLCEHEVRVGYNSLEMPEQDLRNVMLCHRGIPRALLEEPWRLRMDSGMLDRYLTALDEMSDWHLDINFDTKLTADTVRGLAIEREQEFVIIDHIHRLGWGDRRNFEQEVQTMTNLALDQNIPVLMLCQLRKSPRGRDFAAYPRPTLQEFRETSIIGDDASIAMALWRQRDESGMHFTGPTELIILKNRHTTGRQDAAGRMFLPLFDIHTQLFSMGTPAVPDIPISTDIDEEDDSSEWNDLYSS